MMRALLLIFGLIVVLALGAFAAKATQRTAAVCDTPDCPASECQ
jgi:hypothetical protein